MGNVTAQIGGHAFQPADRNRSAIQAAAAAGRLARSITGAAQNRRENIGLPVDHVGIGVLTLGDQTDVLGHIRMRRARPLAVDYLVEVIRVANVASLQSLSPEI